MEDNHSLAATSDFSSIVDATTCFSKQYRPLQNAFSGRKRIPDHSMPEPNSEGNVIAPFWNGGMTTMVQALMALQRKIHALESQRPYPGIGGENELMESGNHVEFGKVNQTVKVKSPSESKSKSKRKTVQQHSCTGGAPSVSYCQHSQTKLERHYRMDLRDIPFILSASTSPSHSVTANYQQLLATMKSHSPILCGTVASWMERKKHPTCCGSLKYVLSSLEEEFGQLTFEKDRERLNSNVDCTSEVIERWKGLVDMKDTILRQKNLQIERQKATMSKMQQGMCEVEEKLKRQLLSEVHSHRTSALEARLQAFEAENYSIKAQLAEALTSQNKELGTLSKRLDHKEYQLHHTAVAHEQSSGRNQQLVFTLQEKIIEQESCIRHLQQKVASADAEVKQHLERIDQLMKYMGHMPTMEEHQALEYQNRDVQVECEVLQKKLSKLESALNHAQQTIKEKTYCIQSQDTILTDLENTRQSFETQKETTTLLETKNRSLNEKCHHLQKVVLESERRCRQELQAMRERHRSRFVEATAKLRSQYKSLAKRSRALESQLSRNSDTMMALNGELQNSQGTIGELKTSVKELVSQNQDLLEKNIHLQESSTEAIKISSHISEAKISAAKQLCRELSLCTEELQSTVSLSLSLLKGHEPDVCLLFGSDGIGNEFEADEDVTDDLESNIAQVKCLRHKVEELRSLVSEHFASRLSTACNVQ